MVRGRLYVGTLGSDLGNFYFQFQDCYLYNQAADLEHSPDGWYLYRLLFKMSDFVETVPDIGVYYQDGTLAHNITTASTTSLGT